MVCLWAGIMAGLSIPEKDLPHVFDRHWRGKETAHLGAGLGLAICKAIVEGHGGSIWAESEPGSGTAFHFSVPALGEASGAEAPEERSDEEAAGDDQAIPPSVAADDRPEPAADADVHLLAGDR